MDIGSWVTRMGALSRKLREGDHECKKRSYGVGDFGLVGAFVCACKHV